MTFGDALVVVDAGHAESCALWACQSGIVYRLGSAFTRAAHNSSMAFCSHNTFMSQTCLLETVSAIGVPMISQADTAVKALVLEISPHWILNPGPSAYKTDAPHLNDEG